MGIGFRESKRIKLFLSSNWLCVYCFRDLRRIRKKRRHLDHAIPVSLGGAKYDKENLRPSCEKCNLDKGEQTETEYLETLALRGTYVQNSDDFNPGLFSNNIHWMWESSPQRQLRCKRRKAGRTGHLPKRTCRHDTAST